MASLSALTDALLLGRDLSAADVEAAATELAADASPDQVEIAARWDAGDFTVQVLDRGSGIASAVQMRLGRDLVSTREDGLGMGLVLAYAAVERSGGTLSFAARPGGGTIATVRIGYADGYPRGGL